MVEAQATARGIRTSAQKAGLVCDLIRGKSVNQALATLQFTRKIISRELAKVLRSAVANLQQKDGFSGDIDRLYVAEVFANQGMSMKRVRPAPMGRAFRIIKRTAHLTVHVTERPTVVAQPVAPESGTPPTPGEGTPKRPRGAKPKARPAAKRAKAGAAKKKTGGARKKAAAKGGRTKKAVKS